MIRFTFEGRPVSARPGQSLAAALIASGIRALRETGHGDCRGVFCGIGVCQECLVEIDGRQGIRACMTPVRPGIAVRRQPARPALAALPPRPRLPARHDSPDVLVLGGGV
ncbi:MAG: (2Fe-2S)-binding protein, partial [Alphaproteobacteria bacterium]